MLSPAFDRFRVALRTELRLLALNWIYPLLHLLWITLLVWMFVGRDYRSAQALLETTLGRIAIGMISLAGLFLAGISASRSRRVKFHELDHSFPTGFEVTTGRWLAGILALLFFLVEPLAVATLQGPLASLLDGLPLFLGEAALTVAFTTTFAWALMTWLRPGRWAYPLLAAGWMGFLLGPTMLTGVFPPASLLNFMRQGVSFYAELWGRLVYGQQPFWFNLFYAGLLLACLAALMLGFQVRRFHRPFVFSGVLLAFALILAALGGVRYIAGVQAATKQPPAEFLRDESAPFTVSDYDLALDLSDPRLPHFTARLTVQNTGSVPLDRLSFQLNPSLVLEESNLPFEQDGGRVQIRLVEPLAPGVSLPLILHYSGVLWVESISDGVVEASDFIDPRGLRLTPQAIWYPIPVGPAETPGLHDPAHIRLVVTGSNLPFAANLPAAGENVFEANTAEWVFLIGSPRLVVERFGEVTLITSKADLAQARQYAKVFADPLNAVIPFFPQANVQGLILMVLGEESGLPENTPPVAGYPLVVTQRYALVNMGTSENFSRLFILRALAADLWRLSGGSLDPQYSGPVTGLNQAFGVVVQFLDVYIKEDGDPGKMLAWVHDEATRSRWEPDPALLALVDVYRQGGAGGVAAVLDQVYQRPDELRSLPYESLPEWIRAAGSGR